MLNRTRFFLKPFVLLLAVLAAVGIAARPSFSQEDVQRVTVEGIDAIIGSNQMLARDKALEQALRAAVEQVAGTVVSSETLVENFQLVNDRIYAKAKGFVQSYNIVSEGPVGDGTYKVVVEAVVSKKMLADSLKDLVETSLQLTNKPRTLFMIAEQQLGDEAWKAWWTQIGVAGVPVGQPVDLNTTENTFLQEFTDNGFPVVDLAAATRNMKVSNAYGVSDLTDRQVRELGEQMTAEMVIYGKAYVKQGPQILNSPMYSIPANISVRVVTTDTGRVLTSANESCTIVHSIIDVGAPEALRKCAKKVAEILMPKMVKTIVEDRSVELSIAYAKYKDLVNFKQALKDEIRSIQAVHQRQTGKGSTTLELDLKTGTAQSLADELAVREFSDFMVEVDEVTQNSIKISLVRR